MKVLIACEESGTVTRAFRKLGYDAWSCDTMATSGGLPEYHIQGDVLEILNNGWDLMIAHPPCTYLANSSVQHLKHDGSKYKNKNPNILYGIPRWEAMYEGAMFFNKLKNAPIKRIAIENPIPHKFAVGYIGIYSQIIQPYHFGHMEQKATCLWLKGLPKLKHTNNVYKEMMLLDKKERHKNHWTSPGKDRGKIRSKTYSGIAEAIAIQYGDLDKF